VDAAQAAAIVLAALASLIISSIGAAVLARDRGQSTMA